MRILFISNYYPPYEVGGYEQLCRDVAERLAARGHTLAALTSEYGTEGDSAAKESDIYRRLKLRPSYNRFPGPAAEFFLSRRANTKQNVARLERVLDEYRPEVVFIWNLQRLPRELALACEDRAGVAVAYWLAGPSPAEPDEFWRYWHHVPPGLLARLLKRPLRHLALNIMAAEGQPARPRMDHAAVVSHYMREKGIANGSLPANVQAIYNGVELELFCRPIELPGNGPLKVLIAGRVSSDKGVHTVVEAMGHLARAGKGSKVSLHIAGTGPADYEHFLRNLIAENELTDSVELLGFLPRDEMPQLMSRHHVLVLPSIYPEAFSRVVLEGMAAGLAVVGTTVGGTGELLQHDETGLVFQVEEGWELASQLDRLIEDDELRQKLATNGQRQVQQRFSMELMVDKIEKLLRVALNGT